MNAGSLRDRITVLRHSTETNNRGGTKDVTLVIASDMPAKVAAKRGDETVQAQRLSGITPYDITVRYDAISATIQPSDELRDQSGHQYAIKWVGCLDEGRPRWITIMAETGTVAR